MTTPQTMPFDVEGGQVEHPQVPQNLPPAPPADDPRLFTTEQIEKARREEREKVQREKARLKEQADAMKAELETLRKQQEAITKAKEAEDRKAAKKQKAEDEKDLGAKEILARREYEWEQKFEAMQEQMRQADAKAELERQYMALQVYKQRRLAQETDNIAPQFIDYIDGRTAEELDAAIDVAKQKTAELMDQMAQQASAASRFPGPSLRVGPSNAGHQSEIPAQEPDFTNMTYADYVANRSRLHKATGDQGIFG